jgi:hypothetical protein
MLHRLFVPALACLLTSCGYVGDPLPPALNIPAKISDLAIVQTGDQLRISFTLPVQTTEELAVEQFQAVDLRIGPIPSPFSFDAWAAGARPVQVNSAEPGKTVTTEVPAALWSGGEVLAAVRTRGTGGRWSQWSDSVTFTAMPPLPRPVARAVADPEGIRVTWQDIPNVRYRVWRQGPRDARPAELGTVERPEFVDRNVSLGQSYTYTVQARSEHAESLLSEPVIAVAADVFAPAVPSGLVAIAGVNSIELAWNRNIEPDLAVYRVYRRAGDGPSAVLADSVEGIAYTDRQVQAGTTYSYSVSAVDKSGNESRPSAAVTASLQ